ncbi:uncharacterized protein LOC124814614 isoform X2 [Hydra vulgaris]|uniref:uncharacterized protein LOC124814614 isoform X2 n=1 Tax=Hydra vulgaris TaxID=6087 RepID=UPI0032E9C1D8
MFTELLLIIIELLNQGNCGDNDNIEANVGNNMKQTLVIISKQHLLFEMKMFGSLKHFMFCFFYYEYFKSVVMSFKFTKSQHKNYVFEQHQKEQLHPYSNCCSITIGYQKQLNKSAFEFKILVSKLNTISKMLTKLGYAWLLGAVNGGFNLVF